MSLCLLLTLVTMEPDADTTVRLARGSTVDINATSQEVSIRTGTDDNLTVHGGRFRMRDNIASVSERLDGNDNRTLEIIVPAWAKVRLQSTNGNVTLDGTPTRLDVETTNGNVQVNRGSGALGIETLNGDVNVKSFHGDRLGVDATSGQVTINDGTGSFHLETVNGAIIMTAMQADDIHASTVNDNISFAGSMAATGVYQFESHNGNIVLNVPGTVSARLRVTLFNGNFESPDIQAVTNGSRDTRDARNKGHASLSQEFTVTYGKAEADVTIDSFNGNVSVRKLKP